MLYQRANDDAVRSIKPIFRIDLMPKRRTRNSIWLSPKMKPAVWPAIITATSNDVTDS